MNETPSAPTPRALPSSRRPRAQSDAGRTGSTGSLWIIGDLRAEGVTTYLWNGEGPRCATYWPFPDLESQHRCELRAEHPIKHFLSTNTI